MQLETRGEKVFKAFNYIILSLFALMELYPVIYVLAASLSSPEAVSGGRVSLLPVELTIDSYARLAKNSDIYMAYGNTFFYTIAGTAVSVILDILIAYPLSKKRLVGRNVISFGLAITMWFSAGMIPKYLVIKNLGMLNKRIGLIIPFACSAYYIILLRTFFQSLPDSLEEYAKIEGASDFKILTNIYIPLSKAAIATIIMYIAVSRWNSYFWAMTILRDKDKIPLQVMLKNMVVQMAVSTSAESDGMANNVSQETMVYSTMMVAIIPMLVMYPFIQKYFVKGVMVGGIKG